MNPLRSIVVLVLLVAGLSDAFAWSDAVEAQEQPAKAAFLGVVLDRAEGPGVLVTRVVPKSAAETAGVRARDRIIGIAGAATDTPDDIGDILRKHAAGDSVLLVFRRGNELHVAETELGERTPETVVLRPTKVAKVLDLLRAKKGLVIADIGFGGGWLSLGLADAVGPKGLIYAVEIDRLKVEKMQAQGIPNIKAIHSKKDDVSLPDQSLDIAVLHDVASHVSKEARPSFYASITRALKSDGRLVVFGPHGKARAMLDELGEYGFHAEKEADLGQLSTEELDRRLDEGIRFFYEAPQER